MATKKKPSITTIHKSGGAGMTPWLGIAFIIVLIDQLTKITVTKLFTYGETLPVTSFFNLVLVYNPGAAFPSWATRAAGSAGSSRRSRSAPSASSSTCSGAIRASACSAGPWP